MLYIEKNAPPRAYKNAVAQIKGMPNWRSIQDGDAKAIRAQFDQLPKAEIRDALLAEQHYLCAYCMKRIRNEELHMTIEHWFPLSRDKERALDYRNFLGVCKGGGDIPTEGDRVLCCDASKGNDSKLLINPLDRKMMDAIAYTKDGLIYCLSTFPNASQIDQDINKILCLNGKIDQDGIGSDTTTGLRKDRKDAYDQVQRICEALKKQRRLTSTQIEKLIRKLTAVQEFPEFAGVTLFFLKRKCKQLKQQGR